MLLKSLLWKILGLLLLVSLLAACTVQLSGNQAPTPAPTTQPTQPPATPTQPAVSTCQTNQLAIAYDVSTGLTANRADQFTFQNTSTLTCTLSGYPQVQLLLSNHRSTPTQTTQSLGSYFFTTTLQTVSLQPGSKAYFVVSWVAGTCAQSASTAGAYVEVTLPGDTGILVAEASTGADSGIDACGSITVSPVSATGLLPSGE